jgi:hypothetical protein
VVWFNKLISTGEDNFEKIYYQKMEYKKSIKKMTQNFNTTKSHYQTKGEKKKKKK